MRSIVDSLPTARPERRAKPSVDKRDPWTSILFTVTNWFAWDVLSLEVNVVLTQTAIRLPFGENT